MIPLKRHMWNAEQFDLSFVASLPKRERSRWEKVWDGYQEWKRVCAEKGALLPISLAAQIANVSRQRMYELCEGKQVERTYLLGHAYVTEESLLDWARSERKAGRPLPGMSRREMWKRSLQAARETVGTRK